MQEEVESKTVNLAVSTTKLTARALIRGIRWYIMHRNHKKLRKQIAHQNDPVGEQSVKKLLKGGAGTDKIELPDGSAKDFCRIAKQFGVDYAVRKDKTVDPPRYVVFFKAKDTEVLDQVVKEYTAKTLEKKQRESVREQLKAEKSKVKAETKEAKAKEKEEKAKAKGQNKTQKPKKRKVRTEGR